jgi:hypothetical protein
MDRAKGQGVMEDKKRRRPKWVPLPFLFLIVPLLALPHSARAADCGALGKADFVGAFDYKWDGSSQALKIRIKGNEAQIETEAGQCQARCKVSFWTRNADRTPASSELQCRAPGFSALSSTVTVYWAPDSATPARLKVGKFLDPMDETPLRVERDLLSAAETGRQRAPLELHARHPSSD